MLVYKAEIRMREDGNYVVSYEDGLGYSGLEFVHGRVVDAYEHVIHLTRESMNRVIEDTKRIQEGVKK